MRTIAGCVAPATLLVACSVDLPDTVEEYRARTGLDRRAVDASSDAGQQPFAANVACPPKSPAGMQIVEVWRNPSGLHQGACTTAQADTLIRCVFEDPLSATDTCRQFVNTPANAACLGCGLTPRSAPTWGAIVRDSAQDPPWPNVEGCVGVLSGDPSARGCGAKMLAVSSCAGYLCMECDDASFGSCADAATGPGGACESFQREATCGDVHLEQCAPSSIATLRDLTRHVLKLFCER